MFKNLKNKLEQNIGATLSTGSSSAGRPLGTNTASLSNIKPGISNQSLTGSLKSAPSHTFPVAPENGDSKLKTAANDAVVLPEASHAPSMAAVEVSNSGFMQDLIDIEHNDLLISTSPPSLPSTSKHALPPVFAGSSVPDERSGADSMEGSRRPSRDQESGAAVLKLNSELAARDALIKELEANLIRSQRDFREKLAAEESEKNVWKIACADLKSTSTTNNNSASQKRISDASAEIQALRAEVTKLTQINRSFDAERSSLQSQNISIANQLSELRSQYEENKVDTEAIHAQLNHALEQLAGLSAARVEIVAGASADAEKAEQQAKRIEDLTSRNESLRADNDQLNPEREQLLQEKQARDDSLQQIEQQIEILRTEAERVKAEIDERDAAIASLRQNEQTLQAKLTGAEQKLEGAELYYTDLESQLQTKQQEFDDVTEQSKDQVSQLDSLRSELKAVRENRASLASELEAKTSEFEALKQEQRSAAAASPTSDQQQQTVTSIEAAQLRMLKHALSQHFTLPTFVDADATADTISSNSHAFVDAVVTSIGALKDAKAALGAQLERLIGDVRASKTRVADLERQLDEQREAASTLEHRLHERLAQQADQIFSLNQQLTESAEALRITAAEPVEAVVDDVERQKLLQIIESLNVSAQQQRSSILNKCEALREFSHAERAEMLRIFGETFSTFVAEARVSISNSFADFTAQAARDNAAALQRQHAAALDEAHELTSQLELKIISLDEQLVRLQAVHAASDADHQTALQKAVSAEKVTAQQALDAAPNEYEALHARYARLEEQHESITLDLERVSTQLDSERNAREDAESHVGRTNEELHRLTSALETATAQAEQTKQTNKRVTGERTALQEQLDFLKQDLDVLLEAKTALETRLETAYADSNTLEQRSKAQLAKIEQLETSLAAERDRFEKHQHDHKQIVQVVKRLEDTLRTTEAVAANQKNLCEQFRVDIDRLETSLKAKQRECESQARILEETHRERDSRQAELDSLTAEHRHTLDSLQTLARELTASRSEAEAARETSSSRAREHDEQQRQLETRLRQFQHEAERAVELRGERDDALRQVEQLRADLDAQRDALEAEAKAAAARRVPAQTQVNEDDLFLAGDDAGSTDPTRRQTREQLVQQLNSAQLEVTEKTKALKKQQLRINELKKLVKEVRSSGGSGGGGGNFNVFGSSMNSSSAFADDNISLGSNADSISAINSSYHSQFGSHNNNNNNSSSSLSHVRKATSYNDIPAGTASNFFIRPSGVTHDAGTSDVNTPLLLLSNAARQQHNNMGGHGDAGASMADHAIPATPPPATLMPTVAGNNNTGSVYKDDINFEYMKNVLLKFLGSTHDEAVHLVKPVVTLLHLTPDEEEWLNRVVAWRESGWFSALTAAKPAAKTGTSTTTQAKKVGSGAVGGGRTHSNMPSSSLISSGTSSSSSNSMMRPVPGSAAALTGVRTTNLRR